MSLVSLNLDVDCKIDSNSPISMLSETCGPKHLVIPYGESGILKSINKSKWNVKGLLYDDISIDNNTYIKFYIVDAETVISGFIR